MLQVVSFLLPSCCVLFLVNKENPQLKFGLFVSFVASNMAGNVKEIWQAKHGLEMLGTLDNFKHLDKSMEYISTICIGST